MESFSISRGSISLGVFCCGLVLGRRFFINELKGKYFSVVFMVKDGVYACFRYIEGLLVIVDLFLFFNNRL